MRTFRFRCPRCLSPFAVEEHVLGRPVACPHCQAKIQIPSPGAIQTAANAEPVEPVDDSLIEKNRGLSADVGEFLDNTVGTPPPIGPVASGEGDTTRDALLPDPMAPLVSDSPSLPFPLTKADAELPTAEILVEDRPKTIVYKGKLIELRRLSPEEKQRRRFRRRMLLMLTGAVVLISYLLLKVGKL